MVRKNKLPRIVIEVRGGIVQEVVCDRKTDICIVDYDNQDLEDGTPGYLYQDFESYGPAPRAMKKVIKANHIGEERPEGKVS